MQSDTESMTKGEDAEEDEVEGLPKEEAAEEDGGAPLEEEAAKALNLANQSLLLHVCAALLLWTSPLSSDTSAANSPMVQDVSIGIPPLPPVKAAAGSFCCCCCCCCC